MEVAATAAAAVEEAEEGAEEEEEDEELERETPLRLFEFLEIPLPDTKEELCCSVSVCTSEA